MTGITGSKRPKVTIPPDPSPDPIPIPGREEEEAKKKVRRRVGGGRASTVFAGRMMSHRGDILKTRLG
jgi:hypothetical protein